MSILFDVNQRVDPTIRQQGLPTVLKIALPFLSFYRPTQILSTAGFMAYQIYKEEGPARKTGYLANAALMFFKPKWALGLQFIFELRDGASVPELGHSALHIASIHWARPELIAASLLLQAGKEVYEARKADTYAEGLAKVVAAGMRLYFGRSHFQEVRRDWFGKEITQHQFNQILLTHEGNEPLDFDAALRSHGFKKTIRHIELTSKIDHVNVIFRNIEFDQVDWKRQNLSYGTFENVTFRNSTFDQMTCMESTFRNVQWVDSSMEQVNFVHTAMERVGFSGCNLKGTCFNSSYFDGVWFDRCELSLANFLAVRSWNSGIRNSDLADVFLMSADFTLEECTENVINKPVIALGVDFEAEGWYSGIQDALEEFDVHTLIYDYRPQHIDGQRVDFEARVLLREVGGGPKGVLAAARADSEIAKVIAYANEIKEVADGSIIPGGADVEPEWYGASRDERTYTEDTMLHSVTEFAMIDGDLPTWGVCRGSHMINVWQGGTMRQHVDGQHGFQFLQVEPDRPGGAAERVREILKGDGVWGYSAHHQCLDELGEGIEVALQHGDVVKAFMSRDGRLMGTQFHPEMFSLAGELKEWMGFVGRLGEDEEQTFNLKDDPHMWARIYGANRAFYEHFLAKIQFAAYGASKSAPSLSCRSPKCA